MDPFRKQLKCRVNNRLHHIVAILLFVLTIPIINAQHDHMAVMALVNPTHATHIAENDGDWTAATTWENDTIPVDDALIVIPSGVSVTVNSEISETFRTIRIDGTLCFATDTNTKLLVDTIVTTGTGRLEIGTELNPIDPGVTAKLVIADAGGYFDTNSASPDYDPKKIGQGLIAMGAVEICGAEKTSFTTLAGDALAGATSITLAPLPANWVQGDTIVIAGTRTDTDGDEKREITAIDYGNSTVSFGPALAFDHTTPSHTKSGLDLKIHVGNLTRNVVIETLPANVNLYDTETTQDHKNKSYTGPIYNGRGHIMVMSPNANLRYAALRNLGRTSKLIPIDSSANPKGRYSIHFHQAGTAATAKVHGCAAENSPGWGFVNHSSSVEMTDNVAHNTTGGAFVTEAGDESGSFIGNLAIRNHGTGIKEDGRGSLEDWGHKGSGFWFQGAAGVVVQDNIATGSTGEAFAVYADPIGIDSIATEHMRIPYTTTSEVLVTRAPMNLFENNTAYGSETAVGIFSNRTDDEPYQSEVTDFTAWAVKLGATSAYTSGLIYHNLTMIGDLDLPEGVGHDSHHGSFNIEFHNPHIEGFVIGLQTPRADRDNLVSGGYYNNFVNLWLDPGRRFSTPSFMDLEGFELHISNPVFGNLSTSAQAYAAANLVDAADLTLWNGEGGRFDDLTISTQQDFFSDMHIVAKPPNLNHTFIPMFVTVDFGDSQTYRLYIEDIQNPDTVVFPDSLFSGTIGRNSNIPTQIRDLSNSDVATWSSDLDLLQTTDDKGDAATYQDIFLVKFGQRVNIDSGWILAPGGRLLPTDYLTNSNFYAPASATPIVVNGSSLRLNNTVLEKITNAEVELSFDGLDSEGYLDLGDVLMGNQTTVTVNLTNNGGSPLDLTSISLAGGDLILTEPDSSFTQLSIWPGETRTIELSLYALSDSPSLGTLSFSGNQTTFPSIIIGGNNTSPTPTSDEFTIENMQPHSLNVLINDSDPDNQPLTLLSLTAPEFGEVEIAMDQTITYTSIDPWWSTDTFTYTVTDGFGGTATASVTLTADGSGAFKESGGNLALESENHHSATTGTGEASAHEWTITWDITDSSNGQALQVDPDVGVAFAATTDGPRLDYNLSFDTPGDYYVWVRTQGPAYGRWLHVGTDGAFLPNNSTGIKGGKDTWWWVNESKVGRLVMNVAEPGAKTLNIWMRQDGVRVDSIILSTEPDFIPAGHVDTESQQGL